MYRRLSTCCVLLLGLVFGCDDDGRKVGAECSRDGDCAERCLDDFPGGLCTLNCRSDDDCTADTVCVDTEGGVCLFPCSSTAECVDRFGGGYACDDESTFEDRDVRVCEDSG